MADFALASAYFASCRPFIAKALPITFSLSPILPMNDLDHLQASRNPNHVNNVNLISSRGMGSSSRPALS